MTNEEAAQEREKSRKADESKASEERLSSEDRAAINSTRNADRKQERESAQKILDSSRIDLQEVARQGGALGRKLEREIKRFEQTGKISSWLAGQTIKAEAAQNAAQQSAFKQAVLDVVQTAQPIDVSPARPSFILNTRKPDVFEPIENENCIGLGLYKKNNEVWVGVGTIAGRLPADFDALNGKLIASGGSGSVWAEVKININTGEIVSTTVNGGGNVPEDTDSSFYYELGYYEYSGSSPSITNYACGAVDVVVCRNWFTATAPFYSVSLSRGS